MLGTSVMIVHGKLLREKSSYLHPYQVKRNRQIGSLLMFRAAWSDSIKEIDQYQLHAHQKAPSLFLASQNKAVGKRNLVIRTYTHSCLMSSLRYIHYIALYYKQQCFTHLSNHTITPPSTWQCTI